MKRFLLIVLIFILALAGIIFFQPGGYLVVNQPEKSDAIVVLAGLLADARYWRGMELLRSGYGQHLVVDAGTGVMFGQTTYKLAEEFVAKTAGANISQVSVCPVAGDSTKDEAPQINDCLQRLQPPPHSVIVVTDEYHTRRALSILRTRLPQYQWSAATAKNDFIFGLPWWRHREWAKTYVTEWQKLIWWNVWDRWRS